jgi:hypothetical protein
MTLRINAPLAEPYAQSPGFLPRLQTAHNDTLTHSLTHSLFLR